MLCSKADWLLRRSLRRARLPECVVSCCLMQPRDKSVRVLISKTGRRCCCTEQRSAFELFWEQCTYALYGEQRLPYLCSQVDHWGSVRSQSIRVGAAPVSGGISGSGLPAHTPLPPLDIGRFGYLCRHLSFFVTHDPSFWLATFQRPLRVRRNKGAKARRGVLSEHHSRDAAVFRTVSYFRAYLRYALSYTLVSITQPPDPPIPHGRTVLVVITLRPHLDRKADSRHAACARSANPSPDLVGFAGSKPNGEAVQGPYRDHVGRPQCLHGISDDVISLTYYEALRVRARITPRAIIEAEC
jgi:hypothetical protein